VLLQEELLICFVLELYTGSIELFVESVNSRGRVVLSHSLRSSVTREGNRSTGENLRCLAESNWKHLVASRQQVVFALRVPSCQQVWNKLLTTCNNLVDIIRLVARLFQQVRCSHGITILLQPCVVNLVTFLLSWLYQTCSNNLVTSLIVPSRLSQVALLTACSKLVTTTGNKQCEDNLLTACEKICNNLFADL
jgi:hypothetical protein